MANPNLQIRSTLDERAARQHRSDPGVQACPQCSDHMPVVYAKPIPGAPSGHFERTGDCRSCGPVVMKSGRLSDR